MVVQEAERPQAAGSETTGASARAAGSSQAAAAVRAAGFGCARGAEHRDGKACGGSLGALCPESAAQPYVAAEETTEVAAGVAALRTDQAATADWVTKRRTAANTATHEQDQLQEQVAALTRREAELAERLSDREVGLAAAVEQLASGREQGAAANGAADGLWQGQQRAAASAAGSDATVSSDRTARRLATPTPQDLTSRLLARFAGRLHPVTIQSANSSLPGCVGSDGTPSAGAGADNSLLGCCWR